MRPEIPLPAWAGQPCERLARLQEDELQPLATDAEAAAAQLRERSPWMARDAAQEAIITRLCRQRDEAVNVGARANQLLREPN